MFCALPLYIVYAVLQGCAFAMAGLIHLRLHSFGNLELLTRIPMSIKAGLTGDIINFVICVIAFFVIGYLVAYFMIGKLKLATPGRLAITAMNPQRKKTPLPQRKRQEKSRPTAGRSGSLLCWADGRTSCWWMRV